MTCEQYERPIALAIEGDLPESEQTRLTEHVSGCTRCRAFEVGLKSSQEWLKSLADEPLPEMALAVARVRALAAVPTSSPRGWAAPRWAWWAAAAGLTALALAVVWQPRPTTPVSQPVNAQVDTRPSAQPVPAPTPAAHSTHTARAAGSPHVKPARRPRVEPMSPEEADQLARALVAISRLERLDGEPAEVTDHTDVAAPPLTRIASDDPNVVIYWQFESNGG